MNWTALLLAGSRPGADPFAAAHGTDLKALIPLAGQPMVTRPVAALLASAAIGRVRVLAQAVDRIAAVLPDDPRVSVEASGATIAATLDAILSDPATVAAIVESLSANRADDIDFNDWLSAFTSRRTS